MWFLPSYHLAGASPLPLNVGYLFLVGSNILLSMVVQQWVVILEFTEDERISFYSAICHSIQNFQFILVQSLSYVQLFVPQEVQHARLPCPSPAPGVCSNSCPLIRWCHPTISSSVALFSSCLQSFPASRSFLMSWLFARVLELQLQSFQWIFRVISFRMDWLNLLDV